MRCLFRALYHITKGAATYVSATANFTVKNTMELPTIKAVSVIATNEAAIVDECLTTDVCVTMEDGNGNMTDEMKKIYEPFFSSIYFKSRKSEDKPK